MEGLAYGFEFNTKVLVGVLEGFGENEFRKRFENTSSALWIVGHVAHYRRSLCEHLEIPVAPVEWASFFEVGSSPDLPETCPPVEQLFKDIQSTGQLITEKLRTLKAEDLNAAKPFVITAAGSKTLLHNIQFLFFHESYHIGQLGLIRKMLGFKGLA